MSSRVWLLDFDGVINALSHKGDRNVWPSWNTADITIPDEGTYTLLWSKAVVELVQEAVESGVDVIWLTTWREHTKHLPTVIDGLPNLTWWDETTLEDNGYELDPTRVLSQRWKAQVAQTLLDPKSSVMWTDDNLGTILNGTDRGWFKRRHGGTTLLEPRAPIGMSKKDVREVREWFNK